MKALKNKILVKAHLNQKDSVMIKGEDGKNIELWVGSKYRENYRERSPVIAEIIDNGSTDYNYLKVGDLILVHHNYVSQWETNPFCIEYSMESGEGVFSLPADRNIFCKLNEDGTVQAICGNIVGERLKKIIKTNIIVVPDSVKQEHNDRVKVLSVSPEIKGIYPKQTVLIMQYSDYEIVYTWKGKEYSVIKVWQDEIIGVLNEN